MKPSASIVSIVLLSLAAYANGQTTTQAITDPDVQAILQSLHDRKDTLKDFTAQLDYSVYHPKTFDTEGKLGDISFVNDATKGPAFSVKFSINTVGGIPHAKIDQDVIFDGTNLTVLDSKARTFRQENIVPAGSKPGEAVSLKGPIPLPIGLDVQDVNDNFIISKLPSTDANAVQLRLVPRTAGKFDFKQLDVTVDNKLQLPTKLVQTARTDDVTTFEFKEITVNSGKAHLASTEVPKAPGWQIETNAGDINLQGK